MDNNFYNILQIFKRLDEGMTKDAMWRDAERMTREQFCDKWGDEHGEFWDKIVGEMDEGSMADAEHHPKGPKFGGYWKGTDKNPPKPGQGVGGCEESAVAGNYVQGNELEEELMQEWEQYMQEAGANNPAPNTGIGTSNPQDQAKLQAQSNLAQQNINKIKSVVGTVPGGVSPSVAAKSAVQLANDPKLSNPTGAGMDQNAKKSAMGLGQEMEKLMATGNPAQVQQVANAIKQTKMGQK